MFLRLDPEQQEQLIGIIKILLSDNSTMVLGSAVAAFEEICPERYDLIHPHYRKLCHLLADIDEWGQIVTIGMLTRYARTQFTDPGKEVNNIQTVLSEKKEKKAKKPKKKDKGLKFFNDDSSEGEEEDEEEYSDEESDDEYADLDPDHRLLLTASLPLLKSRNTGVSLISSFAQQLGCHCSRFSVFLLGSITRKTKSCEIVGPNCSKSSGNSICRSRKHCNHCGTESSN